MNRRFLAGPLVLILIGVLLLLRNLRPGLISWEMVATYWPFILVVWGLLRLTELTAWWLHGKPLPSSGITGGEWVLALLICLVGSTAPVVRVHWRSFPSDLWGEQGVELLGQNYDYPVTIEKPIGKSTRLVIENLRGKMRVVGRDTAVIHVEGRKTIRSLHQEEAEQVNAKTPFEITIEGEQIFLRLNPEQRLPRSRVSLDLDVTVPRSLNIQASGRFQEFAISDLDGNVEADVRAVAFRAHNIKGRIELLGRNRNVELEDISGDVVLGGDYSGALHFARLGKSFFFQSGSTEVRVEKLPGTIDMDLRRFKAADLIGPVSLRAKSRDVSIEDLRDALSVTLEQGDIMVDLKHNPSGRIEVVTKNGNVDLRLPASARFQLSAVTRRGEVTNSFGEGVTVKPQGQGATAAGALGKGPMIHLATGLGTISLSKG